TLPPPPPPPPPPPARGGPRPTPDTPPPGVTALRLHRPPDDAAEDSDDLPRRVRQANLAPQLRERRSEEPAQASAAPSDDQRTPELVRDRMAAYREGWARGGGRQPGRGDAPDSPAGSDSSSEGDPE
ncbi:ATPase, partial [Streptomyces sp. NPDC058678]